MDEQIKMRCAGCDSICTFVLASPASENSLADYVGDPCGWQQTSPQGGYCEIITGWLHSDGAAGLATDDVFAAFLWRACQGETGKRYARILAEQFRKKMEEALCLGQ